MSRQRTMNNFMGGDFRWSTISKTSSITPEVKQHLLNVYNTLALGILSAALGTLFFLKFKIGGTLSFITGILMIFWLSATPREDINKRVGILLGFCFMEGISIAPLVWSVAQIDPALIVTAFLGTVCVFACFSASAVFAQRRSFLYLGGVCGSALSLLLLFGFLNVFFASPMMFNVMLYGGLLIFCGYVMFDTQIMIEKALMGEKDFVWDCLQLFLDFVAFFYLFYK